MNRSGVTDGKGEGAGAACLPLGEGGSVVIHQPLVDVVSEECANAALSGEINIHPLPSYSEACSPAIRKDQDST